MEKIVFLDRGTLPVPIRKPAFTHEWQEFDQTPPEEVVKRLAGASVAITNKVKIQADELAALPTLRFIAVAATGFDCVDIGACKSRKIGVSNVPGYTGTSVPEHVFALVLALRRSLTAYHQAVQEGRWQKAKHFVMLDYPVDSISGSTIGLVGYGLLAREVEKRAQVFGMKSLIAERKGAKEIRAGRTAFDEALKNSDVVSLHCPLTPETLGLIGPRELALMKKSALLINTARGPLVNEQALADALTKETIWGAGIDVLSEEPPRSGSPLLSLKHPRLLVTPHIGWTSQQALARLAEEIVANVEAYAAGAIRNRVA